MRLLRGLRLVEWPWIGNSGGDKRGLRLDKRPRIGKTYGGERGLKLEKHPRIYMICLFFVLCGHLLGMG